MIPLRPGSLARYLPFAWALLNCMSFSVLICSDIWSMQIHPQFPHPWEDGSILLDPGQDVLPRLHRIPVPASFRSDPAL